ncbi:MAG: methionyl-tRNA formyltransferase [candidate division WOR-3 bacterium]
MRVIFFGTPEFAVPSLVKIHKAGFEIVGVITAKEKPKGRGLLTSPSPIKIKAQELELEVYEPEDPNCRECYELLAQKKPEVGVLVAYGYLIKRELLNLPTKGFINLHPSLLPRYRGAAPINWAIIHGEKETGVTTFFMNEKMDAGKIICQEIVTIGPDETFGELSNRLAELGAELLVATLKMISQGNYQTIAQDDQKVTFAPKIKDKDRLIDWTKTNLEIHNRIRGLSPTPTAYTYFRGKRVEIFRSTLITKDQPQELEPGTILVPSKDLIVATGKGLLNITQLKMEGHKLITGRDFINGQRISFGERFAQPILGNGERDN